MKASVIVLSWNGMEYLEDCLDAVLAQDYSDFEIIVVDNGSTDGSADFVAERYPQVRLICNERNLGFAAGNNIGMRAATGDVLVLLNQDTEVHPGWLEALIAAAEDPEVGIVGCKLLYADGTIQHAGGYLSDARGESRHIGRHELDKGQYDQLCEVDFVTGAAVAVTRSALTQVGLLDEGFGLAYFEDVDWCYRARKAGLGVLYCPAATAIHYESTTVRVDHYDHKSMYHYARLRFLFKHKTVSCLQKNFAPAEMDWVKCLGRTVEMMAVRDAYLRIMISLPELCKFRLESDRTNFGPDFRKEWSISLALVSDLRSACSSAPLQEDILRQLEHTEENAIGSKMMNAVVNAADPDLLSYEQELDVDKTVLEQGGSISDIDQSGVLPSGLLAQLESKWRIKEQPFHSDFPILGRAIAVFRHAWNNISTRWYVLPLLQQQVDFNRSVTRLVTYIAGNQVAFAERQKKFAERQVKLIKQQTGIAMTQIAILHILKQILDNSEGQKQDVVQNIREIDTLALSIIRLQQKIKELEKSLVEPQEM